MIYIVKKRALFLLKTFVITIILGIIAQRIGVFQNKSAVILFCAILVILTLALVVTGYQLSIDLKKSNKIKLK